MACFEAVAADEPHRVVWSAVRIPAQGVDGDDAGVFQAAGDLGFAHEAGAAEDVIGELGLDLLERHLAVEFPVVAPRRPHPVRRARGVVGCRTVPRRARPAARGIRLRCCGSGSVAVLSALVPIAVGAKRWPMRSHETELRAARLCSGIVAMFLAGVCPPGVPAGRARPRSGLRVRPEPGRETVFASATQAWIAASRASRETNSIWKCNNAEEQVAIQGGLGHGGKSPGRADRVRVC